MTLTKVTISSYQMLSERIFKKLGYQALFDCEDAFQAVEFAIEHGFTCVELNQTDPSFFPEKYSPIQRKRLRDYLFPILIHAPEGLSLFNLHKKALNGALERYYEIIDFASEIGALALTLHLGSTFTVSIGGKMEWAHHLMAQKCADALKYALEKLVEYASRKIPICVENTSGFRYEISHFVLPCLLSTRNLWLTWDIGHTHRLKDKSREENFFLKFLKKVREVHLHDNHGDWDEHAVPGTGTVDFVYYFQLLEQIDPYYIIEVRPKERSVESLQALREILK